MSITNENNSENTLGTAITKRVEVLPYDTAWPVRFEEVRQYLLGILSNQEVRVEHVGSTSVPDLAAKPSLISTLSFKMERTLRQLDPCWKQMDISTLATSV